MPHVRLHAGALCAALAALALLAAPPADGRGKPRVAALQVGLQARGLYDGTIHGRLDARTAAALESFRRRRGLAGDTPWRAVREAFGTYGRFALGSRELRAGARGWDVAALQFLLAWQGFPSGTFDGDLGPRTDAALRAYQRWLGVSDDGVARAALVRRLRAQPPSPPLSLGAPVAARPADRFGPRGDRFHAGVDFPARHGARVVAARRGLVLTAGWDAGGFGNLVVVRHRSGVTTWYAHLARVRVRPGDRVARGGRLGNVGSTGLATGPHLHLEVRLRGAAVDPLPALR